MASRGITLLCVFSYCFIFIFAAEDRMFYFGTASGVDKVAESTGKTYWAYYGIPFAEPPVGDLRFKPPKRFEGRGPKNVISTNQVRTACYQPAYDPDYKMSEDCLYLNVFVPEGTQSKSPNPKSVMVWIYGVPYATGDTYAYRPSRLVTERDVIVVTINFRNSIFGFMSSGHGDGNYGLLDIIQALNWVKENIFEFGGNTNEVTIFGQDSGSISASLLSISPKAKDLFSKVILQSGTALTPAYLKRRPGKQFDKLAKITGCSPWFYYSFLRSRSAFRDSITECLRRIDAQDLVMYVQQMNQDVDPDILFRYAPFFGTKEAMFGNEEEISFFAPVVDGEDGVVPKEPERLMNDRNYLREVGALDRSFIVGFNNNEGLAFSEMYTLFGGSMEEVLSVENATRFRDDILRDWFPLSVPESFRSVTTYEYLYPQREGFPELQGVLNLGSDYSFGVPSIRFVRKLLEANKQMNIYMYLFDHFPTVTVPQSGVSGSSHSMELAYLFDKDPWLTMFNYYTTVPDPNGSDSAIYDVIQGAWAAFAKTGSPDNYLSDGSSPWPRYDVEDQSYLAISTKPEVRQYVYAKRMALWTEFTY